MYCTVKTWSSSTDLLAELEERSRALLLFLAAVYVHDGYVDVVQKLRVELDRVTRGEEHLQISGRTLQPRVSKRKRAVGTVL